MANKIDLRKNKSCKFYPASLGSSNIALSTCHFKNTYYLPIIKYSFFLQMISMKYYQMKIPHQFQTSLKYQPAAAPQKYHHHHHHLLVILDRKIPIKIIIIRKNYYCPKRYFPLPLVEKEHCPFSLKSPLTRF